MILSTTVINWASVRSGLSMGAFMASLTPEREREILASYNDWRRSKGLPEEKAAERARIAAEKEAERQRVAAAKAAEKEAERQAREAQKRQDAMMRTAQSMMTSIGREAGKHILRGIFGGRR